MTIIQKNFSFSPPFFQKSGGLKKQKGGIPILQLLYGTGNPGKLSFMRRCVSALDIEVIGLSDISIDFPQVEESGHSPLENARIKAHAYYKAIQMPVFSCDSGLFFKNVPKELQPGVHVRNIGGNYLSDDEMIAYYSALAKRFGGALTAQYKNGICLVVSENEVYEYSGEDIHPEAFILTENPHTKRIKGLPLESLAIHRKTHKYYFDLTENTQSYTIDKGFQDFFKRALFS